MRRLASVVLVLALGVGLGGCGASEPSSTPATSTPTPTPTAEHSQPSGDPRDVVTGLAAPWSIVRVGDEFLVSQRDDARILRVTPGRPAAEVGTVPGVVALGEGGLLGLATLEQAGATWIYAYLTAAEDNRIVRMSYDDGSLGEPEVVLAGIGRAGNHNGGRIAFGPDGMLYATVGDASMADAAQNPDSLNGKILRMTPEGAVPDDNPTAGSFVYSMGHRNPQGLAWDSDGQLWAAEFGQETWDEFNRIEPGANYGWPIVEGAAGDSRFVDPALQWPTSEASPSGLAYVEGTFYLASLRGQRIWAITVDDAGTATGTPFFVEQFGRIRDVAAGADGTLWFVTNNTDGRGDPRDGDDRVLEVDLEPLAAG